LQSIFATLHGDLQSDLERARKTAIACEQGGDIERYLRARVNIGFATLYLGDPDRAADELIDTLIAARSQVAHWEEGYAAFALGMLNRLWRNLDTAVSWLRRAERIFSDAGDLHASGYASYELGIAQAAGGRSARGHMLDALHAFRRAGSRHGMRTALKELYAFDTGRPEPDAVKAAREPGSGNRANRPEAARTRVIRADGTTSSATLDSVATIQNQFRKLTRRERDVARLLSSGLTNRQIGEQMVIAERTVDTHVQRILAKLECATRVQVAVLVTTLKENPCG
jgi:non-specific serine/threonine protein kinase